MGNITGDTGIFVRNIMALMDESQFDSDEGWKLRGADPFPGGQIVSDSQIEFRVMPHLEVINSKYQLRAMMARDSAGNVREPFMGSLQAPINEMETEWSTAYRVQDLVAAKQVHSYYDVHLKHANSESPVNFLAHYNPRTPSFQQGTTLFMESSAYLPEVEDVEEDTWFAESLTIADPDGLIDMSGDNGFWGEDNDASGSTQVAMFTIPSVPLLSLGGLQHMPSTIMVDEPAFPIGNSWAHPFVGLSKLSQQPLNEDNNLEDWAGDPRTPERTNYHMTRADWSYLLNDVLWDGYYFSGLAPLNLQSTGSTVRERWEDHLLNGTPFPNSAYQVVMPDGVDPATIRDQLFHDSANGSDGIVAGDPRRTSDTDVSRYLVVNGMFNINSTSVQAWKSLLASARKAQVDTVSGTEQATGSVFSRFDLPAGGENENWDGYRSLTDEQLQRLAEEIVVQVRERGPFMNLGEFVNRRLASTPDPSGSDYHVHMEKGALQAAIDASGINTGRFTDTLQNQGMNPVEINPWVRGRLDMTSETAMGANGYLTQADVLTVIGPLLSARSDTFTIRSYGEITNTAGQQVSRAWCEAVVQRLPYEEKIYGDGTPRRGFKVLQFRWLDASEI